MPWLNDLFAAAHKLSDDEKKRIVRIVSALAVLLVLLTVFALGYAAAGPAGSVMVLARLTIGYTMAGISLWVLVVTLPLITFLWLGKTRMGKRLMVWTRNTYGAPVEGAHVQAAKVQNSGILFAALVIAAALLFAGVLR